MKTAKEFADKYYQLPDSEITSVKIKSAIAFAEAYHEDKTRCSEFEIDFNGNVHTRLKFIEGKLSVTGAMNGYGDAIEIDKIKITELALPTPPKINADKV